MDASIMEYHNSKGLRIHYTSSTFKRMVTEFSSNWVSRCRITMGSGASSTGATTLPWPSGYRVAVYPGTNGTAPPAQKPKSRTCFFFVAWFVCNSRQSRSGLCFSSLSVCIFCTCRCHLARGLSNRCPCCSFREGPRLLEAQPCQSESRESMPLVTLREARWSGKGTLADPGGSFASLGVEGILHSRTRVLKNAQYLHQQSS